MIIYNLQIEKITIVLFDFYKINIPYTNIILFLSLHFVYINYYSKLVNMMMLDPSKFTNNANTESKDKNNSRFTIAVDEIPKRVSSETLK